MSRKRNATGGELLTGGTGDVNPQYLHGQVTLSAANTLTEGVLSTPIVRVGPQTAGQAVIMEVLKIYCDMPLTDLDAAGATTRRCGLVFSTLGQGTGALALFDDPRVFAAFEHEVRNSFTAAGTGMLDLKPSNSMAVYDMTDGAGHGILIATDNIFIQGSSNGFTAPAAFRFKILYRFKKVSLIEYIGIVQSQQ